MDFNRNRQKGPLKPLKSTVNCPYQHWVQIVNLYWFYRVFFYRKPKIQDTSGNTCHLCLYTISQS